MTLSPLGLTPFLLWAARRCKRHVLVSNGACPSFPVLALLLAQAPLGTPPKSQVHPDGRALHTSQKATIATSALTRNACGLALVTLGKAQAMAAISLLVGAPAAALSGRGDLAVASPQHATWLQRALRESGLVGLTSLCVARAKVARQAQTLAEALSDDGSLWGCVLLAAVAAFQSAILPPTMVDKHGIACLVDSCEEESGESSDEQR